LVAGCGTTGASDTCAGWRPILVDQGAADRLTRAEKEQVVAHNELGESRGCW
jgi:hypothetical protein